MKTSTNSPSVNQHSKGVEFGRFKIMTQSDRDKMKQEAKDLRKPQVHDREWFKRIDRLLYLITTHN